MLIIKGKNDEPMLSIKLEHIIHLLSDYQFYQWRLLWVDGISSSLDMLVLEDEINNSTVGKRIKGEQLPTFSQQFDQLFELLLIGDKDMSKLHRYQEDDDMKKHCEFVIELVDCSYWLVNSLNDEFNHCLITKLAAEVDS